MCTQYVKIQRSWCNEGRRRLAEYARRERRDRVNRGAKPDIVGAASTRRKAYSSAEAATAMKQHAHRTSYCEQVQMARRLRFWRHQYRRICYGSRLTHGCRQP